MCRVRAFVARELLPKPSTMPLRNIQNGRHEMTTEQWLPVVGYEGSYEVSDQGRVRSLDRVIENPLPSGTIRRQKVSGRELIPGNQKSGGYFYVNLSHKRQRSFHVHRLVMDAFVGPKPTALQTRHLNGNPSDNRLANLAYGTVSENAQDTIRHGRNANVNKTECIRGHPLNDTNVRLTKGGRRDCRYCERVRYHQRRGAA